MEYREMSIEEAERIEEIDAKWYIENAWRRIDGKYTLIRIDWTEHELPNGLPWHIKHFRNTVRDGGVAIGCFDCNKLVGYGTMNGNVFGCESKYVLLDQLFISRDYRNHGIGRRIIGMIRDKAAEQGADKIYVCAASAEDTIAFYRKIGFVDASEINQELLANDPNDIQMEMVVKCK